VHGRSEHWDARQRHRRTRKPPIELTLNVDGAGRYDIQTGVPFLNHCSSSSPATAFSTFTIRAAGDVEVDDHHTVEDIGLTLGRRFARPSAAKKASGARRGPRSRRQALHQPSFRRSERPPFLAYNLKTRQTRSQLRRRGWSTTFLLAFVTRAA